MLSTWPYGLEDNVYLMRTEGTRGICRTAVVANRLLAATLKKPA
jgi:hypothetical protein